MSHSVNATLAARGNVYGDFKGHAKVTQEIKHAYERSPNWHNLKHNQREALEMIAHKIGRILNGDPDYADSWHDIAGYATLVENELIG